MTKPEQGQGSHERPRARPVGRRIAMLLAVPLVALVALWAFAAGTTLTAALQRSDFTRLYKDVGLPAGAVMEMMQRERAAAVAVLTNRNAGTVRTYQGIAQQTDGAVAAFRTSALSSRSRSAASEEMWNRLEALDRRYDELRPLRTQIGEGAAARCRPSTPTAASPTARSVS
ncbi:nitrate- and nitrite sensing domain-containing protein [Actinomadura madurae]|uniref:nitrate- and nitrite sensing domain-containing protein n=1 Tax=Actinomadura madurae TaxID=1993 RepID=UPI0020D20AC3|nr:nitrate- and nitrite sensing domain-containing protein [Actinomadura madurae]MCQ0013889.1 hypothetical protein [Actinomadura madurae]